MSRQIELLEQPSLDKALEEAVFALRGWQPAAHEIWPTVDPISGGRRLRDALDPRRRDKLSNAETERLIALAATRGCLTPLAYLSEVCGCRAPEPITPEAEEGEAVQAFRDATAAYETATRLFERAQSRRLRVAR